MISAGDYRERLSPKYWGLFDIFAESGFSCFVEYYNREVMGSFIVNCGSQEATIRVINDKSQLFIEFQRPNGEWIEKEDLMKELGFPFSRHPSICGLWTGYNLKNQAAELRDHLPELLRLVQEG